MEEIKFVDFFCEKLSTHARRKAALYDGVETANRKDMDVSFFLLCATEELGEIASALIRERHSLALEECVDLAHTALLIAFALQSKSA